MGFTSSTLIPPYATSSRDRARFVGVLATFPGGSTSAHDLRCDVAVRLQGGSFWAKGASIGDTVSLQVVDVDNVLGGGAGAVVAEYVSNVPLAPWDFTQTIDAPTAAEIPAGLYLRAVCTTTAGAVSLGITYRWYVEG